MRGHRRRPQEERGRGPRADRRGSVPARGRAARRPGRRCGVRGSGRTRSWRAAEARAVIDGDDYARVSSASLGLNRGPRIAVIYASGTITSGKSGYDPVNGAIVGSDTLIEYIRQARRDSVDSRHRPAHRQPRRIGGGVRRDLARADDRAQRARRPAARRVDVRPRGVGRLLHRDAGAGHRRAAVDADRLDRHLRRQVRHRRRCTRSSARTSSRRASAGTRRSNSPARPLQRRASGRSWRSSCRPSTTSSSRRSPSRATARRRRSTPSRRVASGPAGRPRRTGWWTSSAGSSGRSRSPSSARRFPPTREVELVGLSAAQELLRARCRTSSRGRRAAGGRRVDVREPVAERAGSAAPSARPVRDVPPRRTAGADAVHVPQVGPTVYHEGTKHTEPTKNRLTRNFVSFVTP